MGLFSLRSDGGGREQPIGGRSDWIGEHDLYAAAHKIIRYHEKVRRCGKLYIGNEWNTILTVRRRNRYL